MPPRVTSRQSPTQSVVITSLLMTWVTRRTCAVAPSNQFTIPLANAWLVVKYLQYYTLSRRQTRLSLVSQPTHAFSIPQLISL